MDTKQQPKPEPKPLSIKQREQLHKYRLVFDENSKYPDIDRIEEVLQANKAREREFAAINDLLEVRRNQRVAKDVNLKAT